ncbi:MAG: radical SAM/SPASM domain-containing protein [Anaerolineae bacterium]
MISKGDFTRRLSEGSISFTSSVAAQALRSGMLRPVIMSHLERYLVAQVRTHADPRRPEQVRQDQVDMARALLSSANRALERKQISREVLRRLLRSLLANVVFHQGQGQEEALQRFAQRHDGAMPPLTMVISPTKTCNLRCVGCYASAGPAGERLEWDVFDRIITEAKTLWGMHFITISGGEPFTYQSQGRNLLDALVKHNDCFFLIFTNGTLFDEQMARRLAEAGNAVPAISVEGFEALTDQRRGAGVFQRVLSGMANLRHAGVPFGISLTGTRLNAEEILSEEFIDFFFEEQQAIFGWLFQYMPIGRGYTLELLPTPEQRLWMWKRTWQIIREQRIMMADFWNCGTVSNGCIAGGRNYLYIDWNGKVMPCVFVPYSPANILDVYREGGTLDDVYDLPYFRGIRQWQWDYALGKERPEEHGNWLIPCSLRDHYGVGRELIDKYQPAPEDEAAADVLRDGNYYEGMVAYDEELSQLFDPIWEEQYLKRH